ncbi:MAG: peptide chain release factor N(5)-glutamine methyltransferase [Pseudomonadota bacterium]
MNILSALNSAENMLTKAGIQTPRLDAEVILASTLSTSRQNLYVTHHNRSVPEEILNRFRHAIIRRALGCPVAYITGHKEFWSIPIKVTPDIMVPRPDTETVVEQALRILGSRNKKPAILDLCTGSGCIAAALAKEFPNASIIATDISPKALDVARLNLAFAGNRIRLRQGDLFEALVQKNNTLPRFDMIVANPPYIPKSDRHKLSRDIVDFEPLHALFGGKTGLDFITRIIKDAPSFLVPGGWLVMEVGKGQAVSCIKTALSTKAYDSMRTAKDLGGIERVVLMRSKQR